jgi:L-malate glycosyltransferase
MRANSHLAALMLQRVIRRERIDIVHANMGAAAEAASYACPRAGIPWLMTVHMPFGQDPREQRYGLAERLICISDFVRGLVQSQSDVPSEKLLTIHGGIDLVKFSLRGVGLDMRRQWGVPQDAFLIGIVARLHSSNDKGHLDLLRMLAMRPQAVSWHLAIIGSGKAQKGLEMMTRSLGIADRVHFAGHILDVPSALEAVDAVALPSYAETLGLSLAEAMAMSKPVVAYDVGGIPEVVEDGRTGFLVPAGDIDGLAEKLDAICCDPDLARQLGQRARERVEECFDIERMVDGVEEVYREVWEPGKGGTGFGNP